MSCQTTIEKVNFVSCYLQELSSREKVTISLLIIVTDLYLVKIHVVDNFKATGCVNSNHKKRLRTLTVSCDENKELIRDSVETTWTTSLRNMEYDLVINRETCRTVLKTEGYALYKLS